MKNVHVSVHAYQGEQIELLKLVKPRFFIPVHGEYRHLVVHSRTATESKIPEKAFVMENGAVWEFDGERAKILEDFKIPTGRHWVFREFDGGMDDFTIKERRAAARAGVVVVDCLVLKRASELSRKPQASLTGFLSSEKKNKEMKEEIERLAEDAFTQWRADNPEGLTREQAVAVSTRKVVRRHLDAKPLVIVNFLSV